MNSVKIIRGLSTNAQHERWSRSVHRGQRIVVSFSRAHFRYFHYVAGGGSSAPTLKYRQRCQFQRLFFDRLQERRNESRERLDHVPATKPAVAGHGHHCCWYRLGARRWPTVHQDSPARATSSHVLRAARPEGLSPRRVRKIPCRFTIAVLVRVHPQARVLV